MSVLSLGPYVSYLKLLNMFSLLWCGRFTRNALIKSVTVSSLLFDAVGKPEGKRPLGRSRCRWGDNIKIDLTEIGWSVMN
jgi:hypothetical protein